MSDSIEPGSDRFTASNGWYIEGGRLHYPAGGYFAPADIAGYVALIEYGRHLERTERDRELGRERVEGYPDYVVYPDPDAGVVVIHELDGYRWRYYDAPGFIARDSDYVASAWFAAQETPKPWLDAEPGEVWVLVVDGLEIAGVVIRHQDGAFVSTDNCDYSVRDGRITAGRRIWPEAGDES